MAGSGCIVSYDAPEWANWTSKWCRATHPSGPFSDMLGDQRLTSKVPCSIAAEAKGACCMALELHKGELGVSSCGGVASAEMKSIYGVRSTSRPSRFVVSSA